MGMLLVLHAAAVALAVLAVIAMPRLSGGQLGYASVAVLGIVWARTHAAYRPSQADQVYGRSTRIQHSADDCWFSALAIGVPLGLGVIAVLVAEVLRHLIQRLAFGSAPQRWTVPGKPSRQLFGASSNTLAVGIAHLVFTGIAGSDELGLRSVGAAVLAILCLQLATHVALITVMQLTTGMGWRRLLGDEFQVAVAQCSQKALGVLIWAGWATAPWTVFFAFPLLLSFQRAQRHTTLLEQAQIDSKTGIANAAHWRTRSELAIANAGLRGRPAVVAIIDLDHFKVVNDSHGHVAGDEVLRQTAERIVEAVRPGDLVGRFGGEEFTVLLGRAAPEEAFVVAERIRVAVGTTPMRYGDALAIPITCSIGISTVDPRGEVPLTEALSRADAALYRAKANGRNRTERAVAADVTTTP
ncbi:MAG: GGDEF domain-containing protein [Frankiaceae bacterium]|nr:GGDEF domain-containing protein [Frankiaceae bacterium]